MSLYAPRRAITLTASEERRYWSKVDRNGDCWEWTAERHVHGYGLFAIYTNNTRRRLLSHRVAASLAGLDTTSTDMVVRHACDNPACCRADHLLVGTQADNMHDAYVRGRMNLDGLALGRGARKDVA